MSTWIEYPKVDAVEALPGHRLLVSFRNGQTRLYDFTSHLSNEVFALLRNEAFFRSVRPDPHGYGILWNDDLDLAESELWLNGQPADHMDLADKRPLILNS